MAHLFLNSKSLERFRKPSVGEATAMELRIGDDVYHATFQRAEYLSHTGPTEPAAPCTLEEVAEIASQLFIAALKPTDHLFIFPEN